MYHEDDEDDFKMIPRSEMERKAQSLSTIKHQTSFPSYAQLKISHSQLQNILKKHLSYEKNTDQQNRFSLKTRPEQVVRLKKPLLGQWNYLYIQPFMFTLRTIMAKAYNHEDLKLSEFQQFAKFFKLSKNQVKVMDCVDPAILQTLRFAIYNKQEIPSCLTSVVVQMAKTNMSKNWQFEYYVIYKVYMYNINCQQFQPPLDLYIQFMDTGLIDPTEQQLNEVFTRNQFFFKSLFNNRQFYPTVSQKKRLIFNQFPYLMIIFDKIRMKNQSNNLGGLKLYLNTILSQLEFQSQDYLLERYLPEVRCRYLKIKSHLTICEIQFLFLALKNIQNLSLEDFKNLYHTRSMKNQSTKKNQVKSWTKFGKVEELCTKILSKKDFHLTAKQLQQLGELLDYQKSLSEDIIRINMIFVILREQSYHNQQFPKSLIRNILWIFKNIPDKKKRKQCCYILLLQCFRLINQNPEKRQEIMKQFLVPELQLDLILDEGRQIALDILLEQKDKKLIFDIKRCMNYFKIVKKVTKETKNKAIKHKAVELYKRLKKLNKFKTEDLSFSYDNRSNDEEIVELLQIEVKNGNEITDDCIVNLLRVLSENNNALIKRSCLTTLRHVVKNQSHGQTLPKKFEENVIQLISNLYFYAYLSEDCKNQAIKLAIQCTHLTNTYALIEPLTKFLLEVYLKSPPNCSLSVNSSYAIYSIALNFRQQSLENYQQAKQFLDTFANKIFKTYKQDFLLTSKGSINILCAIAALAKNQILLPDQLVQQLTFIALKNRNFTQIALMAVLFHSINLKSAPLAEKVLLNICQILKNNQNNQIIGVYILENYVQREQSIPSAVNSKIAQLTKLKKCLNDSCVRLCIFYRNQVRVL